MISLLNKLGFLVMNYRSHGLLINMHIIDVPVIVNIPCFNDINANSIADTGIKQMLLLNQLRYLITKLK